MNVSASHRVIDIDMRGDTELADGVRRGDESAFETIMRRHNRLLFRSARGVLDDDASAGRGAGNLPACVRIDAIVSR